MRITVIIPTYNEEKHVLQAINSAAFADEILIIDSYSTDTTVSIAKKNNCNVIQRKFDNFSNQKNYAIEQAKNDWVMILDADELLTPKLQKEISETVAKKGKEYVAFEIPRHNFFMNKFLAFGSNSNETLIRCINRKYCYYRGLVHEQLIYDGKLGSITTFMYHYTYNSLVHFISKKNKYSHLQSQQLLEKGKKATAFHIVIKPLFRFFNELILRRGILDGVPGITTTAMNGYGVLSRYIKLRTLHQKNKHQNLIDYDAFNNRLTTEAQQEADASIDKKSPSILACLLLPFLKFLQFYLLKMYFLKGIEGYTLSYLQGFKKFKALAYIWMNQRNLT